MNKQIEIYRTSDQILSDAVDRVIVEIYHRKSDGKSSLIAFTGCSAECGTTTVAINTAVALSMAGWNTILVDCDIRKDCEYKRLNYDIKNGLSDYIIDQETLKLSDIVYPTNLEHLRYIPCGYSNSYPLRLLCSAKMKELMIDLSDQYDYVIFDLPAVTIMPDADILFPYMDGIALVAALGNTTKKQLIVARTKMKLYSEQYYGLVVNKVRMEQYKKFIKDYDYFKNARQARKYRRMIRKKIHKGEGYV